MTDGPDFEVMQPKPPEQEPIFRNEDDRWIYEKDPQLFVALQQLNEIPDDELIDDLVAAGISEQLIVDKLLQLDPGFFDLDIET